ncbi:MAG: ATP-binding protein [Planctomycetota bacterium]|jgi:PAS domain S-box-containing protein
MSSPPHHTTSRLLITVACTVALLVVGLAITSSQRIEHELRRSEASELAATVANIHTSLCDVWLQGMVTHLQTVARDPVLSSATAGLLTTRDRQALLSHPGQQTLRQHLASFLIATDGQGFFLIAKDGTSLASMRDSNIGSRNLMVDAYPKMIERAFAGEAVFIPPIPSDVPLDTADDRAAHGAPTMFLVAPVKDDNGQVQALLSLRLNPHHAFNRLITTMRTGHSGEVYAFNRHGTMISESRFNDDLVTLGLLAPNQSTILRIPIQVPGQNTPTHAVDHAIANGHGSSAKGYPDYRGVPVLGAWHWDERFQIGLVAEIDEAEVLAAAHRIRAILILTLTGAMLLAAALIAAVIRARRQVTTQLLHHKGELESLVKERTGALVSSEQQMRSLVDNIPGATYRCLLDADWTMLFMSDAIEGITGYPASDFISNQARTYASVIHPDDSAMVEHVVHEAVAAQQPWVIEYRVCHRDGSLRWLHEKGRAVHGDNGKVNYLDGFILDISQRKDDEERLQQALVNAERASRAKGSFLANMSHEIRTPMNAILGCAQLLAYDHHLASEQREQVRTIADSGEHLLALLNDILNMAQIESGQLTVQTSPTDLHYLIDTVAAIFRSHAKHTAITVSTAIDDDVPRWINTDSGKLRQIIINLVGNAVKFTTTGTITIALTTPDDDLLTITVNDTGPGISNDDLTRIFRPFEQSTTNQHGGTGLGLAICHEFAHLLGGDISATSTIGDGSTFTLTLPLDRCAAGCEADQQQQHIIGLDPPDATWRVLVVDDNRVNQVVLQRALEGIGFTVITAANGAEALERAVDSTPDAILMDVQMPIMDGLEATRRLRADGTNTPIIGVSAGTFDDDIKRCLDAGMNAFIGKPVKINELFTVLGQLCTISYRYRDN